MKKAFNAYIKPLYDKQQIDLGVVTRIEVQHLGVEQKIPVILTYTSFGGNVVTRQAGRTSFYRSLGLMI